MGSSDTTFSRDRRAPTSSAAPGEQPEMARRWPGVD